MALPDPQRSRAVLIGTSRYTAQHLGDLPAVFRNLAALDDVLTSSRLGLPGPHCSVMHNPTDWRSLGSELHRDIDYDGVSGRLEFTDVGEPGSGNCDVNVIGADGSLEVLTNEEITCPGRSGTC